VGAPFGVVVGQVELSQSRCPRITFNFPGSTVEVNTAAPILLADGRRDLYFQPDKFRAQYAADLPETETKLLALTRRPMAERAMTEVSDVADPVLVHLRNA
jgi:hypothetical protein